MNLALHTQRNESMVKYTIKNAVTVINNTPPPHQKNQMTEGPESRTNAETLIF